MSSRRATILPFLALHHEQRLGVDLHTQLLQLARVRGEEQLDALPRIDAVDVVLARGRPDPLVYCSCPMPALPSTCDMVSPAWKECL
jgi:hypothetical protein